METKKILPMPVKIHELSDEEVKRFYQEIETLPICREYMHLWRFLSNDFEGYNSEPLTRDKYMSSFDRRQELKRGIDGLIDGAICQTLHVDYESTVSYLDYLIVGLGDGLELRKTLKTKEREIGPLICKARHNDSGQVASSEYPGIDKILEFMCCKYVRKLDHVVETLKALRK